jgi:hypothetical protein
LPIATEMLPVSSELSCAAARARSMASSVSWISGPRSRRNRSPASVSASPFGRRLNSGTPMTSSSRFSFAEIAGMVSPSCVAAALSVPCVATS